MKKNKGLLIINKMMERVQSVSRWSAKPHAGACNQVVYSISVDETYVDAEIVPLMRMIENICSFICVDVEKGDMISIDGMVTFDLVFSTEKDNNFYDKIISHITSFTSDNYEMETGYWVSKALMRMYFMLDMYNNTYNITDAAIIQSSVDMISQECGFKVKDTLIMTYDDMITFQFLVKRGTNTWDFNIDMITRLKYLFKKTNSYVEVEIGNEVNFKGYTRHEIVVSNVYANITEVTSMATMLGVVGDPRDPKLSDIAIYINALIPISGVVKIKDGRIILKNHYPITGIELLSLLNMINREYEWEKCISIEKERVIISINEFDIEDIVSNIKYDYENDYTNDIISGINKICGRS